MSSPSTSSIAITKPQEEQQALSSSDNNDQDENTTKTSNNKIPRIACLLPSATEICGILGLAHHVKGITHECDRLYEDNPYCVYDSKLSIKSSLADQKLYALTTSRIDPHAMSQGTIDREVKQSLSDNFSLYDIDSEAMKEAKPDVVITQSLCDVCAPSMINVKHSISSFEPSSSSSCSLSPWENTKVKSLEPANLKEVGETFITIGNVCNVPERGKKLQSDFWNDLNLLKQTIHSWNKTPPKVLMLEWIDPPFDGGHWVPEMIQYAGCIDPLDQIKKSNAIKSSTNHPFNATNTKIQSQYNSHKSKQISWDDVIKSDPDVVLVACCGFDLKRNITDAKRVQHKLANLRAFREDRVYACDGNQYFARPGPSLVGGAAIVARVAFDTHNSDLVPILEKLAFLPKEGVSWQKVNFAPEIIDMEDLAISQDFYTPHQEANQNKKMCYDDPATGFSVFTEYAHLQRGKCCGSGCRHCPYSHENLKDKIKYSQQPTFLYDGEEDDALFSIHHHDNNKKKKQVKVLFFSGGKDSYLTIRALVKSHQNSSPSNEKFALVLLTTFDAKTRIIAQQETHIDVVLKQAKHLKIALIGVPIHRGSAERYVDRVNRGIQLVAKRAGIDRVSALVFGDLHLNHVRDWRDVHMKTRLGGIPLEYPLWKVPYDELLDDLEESGVVCEISASMEECGGGIERGIRVGTVFNREFSNRIVETQDDMDGFGENGEFHSVANVWVVPREQALGLN